jgi:hypothetical protein
MRRCRCCSCSCSRCEIFACYRAESGPYGLAFPYGFCDWFGIPGGLLWYLKGCIIVSVTSLLLVREFTISLKDLAEPVKFIINGTNGSTFSTVISTGPNGSDLILERIYTSDLGLIGFMFVENIEIYSAWLYLLLLLWCSFFLLAAIDSYSSRRATDFFLNIST